MNLQDSSQQQSIAHYRVVAKLGEGGMGAVYRATDTKLNRDVAIKVLPDAFANDPDRLARFTREAQVLASLNHPNIAHIYGVEDRALVMELVEGNAPAGPLSEEEALMILQQLIDGLEYAHDRGIVHRDLKPANLKLTPDRQVKILDFGLAKALSTENIASAEITNSPTMTMRATGVGMIIGTAAYMAPEQARGHAVDKRADIWSFGVVLYELLTGKQLFHGETVSDTIAAVLMRDPDLSDVPPRFRKLLRLCLMRDPKQRLRDISGVRLLLDEPERATIIAPSHRPWGWIAAGALAIALVGVLAIPKRAAAPEQRPLLRFEVEGEAGTISPDGTRIAYVRRGGGGIMTRRLDETEARPLAGTDGAGGIQPTFSPDGQWILFATPTLNLRKIPVAGGPSVSIPDNPTSTMRPAWGDDGYVMFAPSARSPIWRVLASGGGKAEPVTALDSSRGEVTHRNPFVLPGAKILLFAAATHGGNYDDADIVAYNLETKRRAVLYHGGFAPNYTVGPSGQGYVLFVRGNTLLALPFDPAKMQVREPAVPIIDGVNTGRSGGGSSFSLSNTGVAVFRAGVNSDLSIIEWLDADGRAQPLPLPAGIYTQLRVSPDGKRILYRLAGEDGPDLWIYDTQAGNRSRLTSSRQATLAIWARDGRHVLYQDADQSLHWIRSDGSSPAHPINLRATLCAFAPDGQALLADIAGQGIALIPWQDGASDDPHLGSPRILIPNAAARATGNDTAEFSPDSRWLAYNSGESGRSEVYVRPFPSLDRKWQVSQNGGTLPQWSARSELFFSSNNKNTIMAARYSAQGNEFRFEQPRAWNSSGFVSAGNGAPYSLAPDGSRVIAQVHAEPQDPEKHPTMVFLVNFPDEVERKVKAAGK
jgi:serine/threonine-protein kinase